MALPTFTVGQVLTAADTNQYLVNTTVARKTATETVTSSAVLQDDDHLTVSVSANCTYEFTCQLRYDGATTGDLQYQFVGPASATLFATAHQLQATAATSGDDQTVPMTISTPLTAGALGTGSTVHLFVHGFLVVAGTAGTCKLQWAQGTSSGTGTRVFADSYIVLRQIL